MNQLANHTVRLSSGASRGVYLCGESEGEKRPGIILLHEALGLTADIVRIADRLAAEGFVVCAPDLFEGHGPQPFCLLRAVRELGKGGGAVLTQIEDTRAWLVARAGVHSEVGVMGFCMGGGFAVLAAGTGNYAVAAPFYAEVPTNPAKLPRLCPTVASFGATDDRFAGRAERLTAHLERAGVAHDVVTYPGVGHSFMNHHPEWLRPIAKRLPIHAGYDEHAAEDSFRRVLAFFRRYLPIAA